MSMIRNHIRRASKQHICMGCQGTIHKGDLYIESVASPGWADLGIDGWLRYKECAHCANRYGRDIDPQERLQEIKEQVNA